MVSEAVSQASVKPGAVQVLHGTSVNSLPSRSQALISGFSDVAYRIYRFAAK